MSKKKDAAKNAAVISRSHLLLVVCLICILMISSAVAMILQFASIIEQEAVNISAQYTENALDNLQYGIDAHKIMAKNFGDSAMKLYAEIMENKAYYEKNDRETFENLDKEFYAQVSRLRDGKIFMDILDEDGEKIVGKTDKNILGNMFGNISAIRFFKDGVEYDIEKKEIDMSVEDPDVLRMVQTDELTCIGVITDKIRDLSVVAFCIPLQDCEYADTLILFYPISSVVSYKTTQAEDAYSKTHYTTICSVEGEVVRVLYAEEGLDIREHSNIYDVLRNETNNKSIIDDIQHSISSGERGTYVENVSGHTSIITVGSVHEYENTSFAVIGYSRADNVYESGYFVIRTVLGEIAIFFVILLAVGIYGIIHRWRTKRMYATMNDTNKLLDCPSKTKFERVSQEIIEKNKATLFAVIVIEVNHYDYIVDQIGLEAMVKILKHIKLVINRMLQLDETYGYLEDGKFAILLHYSDMNILQSRLNTVISLASHHSTQFSNNYMIILQGGIYLTERKVTAAVPKMIDLATDAEGATKYPCDFGVFRIHNETLYASSVQNEYIETHMEAALKNNAFKVFYQPKYNIAEKEPDGCEALVRWYDVERKEYMQPDVFLPLFEVNRFIVKLDHYVFEQVCLYIQDAVLNGLPLYPVSVNVSRVTATENDFLDFYIKKKMEYNIDDGFLTLEFVESFAYEDYEMLRNIVTQLHRNGFKCCIDDFGAGFSSYNILKELPMDEIKLDRLFLRDGFSRERDLQVLASVTDLARKLHMKVTQKGVEFEDQVQLLKRLGCQAIQGYYYSKPLSVIDYVSFLSDNKKI